MTDAPSRMLPLAEELLDNTYARENLREGAEKLRDAYERAQKRRVKPSRDRKLRRQFAAGAGAALALSDGLRESVFGSAKALGEEISSGQDDGGAEGSANAGQV